MDIKENIKKQIADNKIILYMKGSPNVPQCGFSSKVANILLEYNIEFAFVNVLEVPEVRANLPQVSNWPTFPQLFIDGKLIGGADIIQELQDKGELATLINNK